MVYDRLASQATTEIENIKSCVGEVYSQKVKNAREGAMICKLGGDPAGWLCLKPLSEWDDFNELLDRCKETLHNIKPATFKSAIVEGDALVKEGKELIVMLGACVQELDEFARIVDQAALTKSIGKMMRWFEKKTDKGASDIRNNLRSELQELKKRFGDSWDYSTAMPSVLSKLVKEVLLFKRK